MEFNSQSDAINTRVNHVVQLARAKFPDVTLNPKFGLMKEVSVHKVSTFAECFPITQEIKYHPALLSPENEKFLIAITAHELAHIIARVKFDDRAHGSAWKWVAKQLGWTNEKQVVEATAVAIRTWYRKGGA